MKEVCVRAFAPATVANVGLGFDFMGFAVEGAGDRVEMRLSRNEKTTIRLEGKYGHMVPGDPSGNTAGVACMALLTAIGSEQTGLDIRLEKNLPLGSGMGSSASSSAAALIALNRLLDDPFTVEELIPFAMEGERTACGTAHADNVAPSLMGGFVIIRGYDPLDIIKLRCPDDLFCALIHPHVELKTSDSRRVLRKDVPLADVTRQCANVASFITGLFRGDFDLIGRSMHDILAEPKRQQLIPGYELAREAAISSGAISCSISGSGPSLFALCKGKDSAVRAASSMQNALHQAGIGSDMHVTSVNAPGARIEHSCQ
ncbi:MAG TPA: homoserine kinase [Bacteroidales bacterium]|nr:homoserine kinase [Bacteroidales bacterium]